ncbi:unnamed protein product [Linum tenue]|uniref:Uncharacterized protein n=1 Tax=Linum tenue TaxID=586396 RepID=A0AAV0HPV8_9ROSI|nr:unnamed protein product [Linum tenue]
MAGAINLCGSKSAALQNLAVSFKDTNHVFLGGSSLKVKDLCWESKLRFSSSRRAKRLGLVVAAVEEETISKGSSDGRFYFNFTGFPFPLGPFLNRRTLRTEAVKGSIWLFEQEQALGFSSVSTNIRMTVIKLKSGGLWVHAPIAPTKECVQVLHL